MIRNKQKMFALCLAQAAEIVGKYRAECPPGFEVYNAETLVSDVIVPELFTPAAIELTATLSAFWQSGIIDSDPQFAAIATGGGKTETMPFWQDLTGNSEEVSDTTLLSTAKVQMAEDACYIHERAKAWSYNDLAGILSGSNPSGMIQSRAGNFWALDMQDMLLATLKGVFAASDSSMAGNQIDFHLTSGSSFTTANYLNADNFIDAQALMGDAASKLVAIAMHSAVYFNLRKNDLIDFIKESEAGPTIPTYQGLRVIVADKMTIDTENGTTTPSLVYSTFLFGQGAVAWGVGRKDDPVDGGAPGSNWETEFGRVPLGGQSYFINRRRMILHPRGVKFTAAAVAGKTPTYAELATGTNWTRAYEAKNVRIVRVKHNVNLS